MNKKITKIFAWILAVVIFGGAVYLYRYRPFSDEEPAAGAGAPAGPGLGSGPVPVRAVVVGSSTLQDYISVNGSTVSEAQVTITSEVPGKVTKILFREGGRVEKGALLVQLDTDELEAQRQRLLVRQELTQKIAGRLKNLYDKEGVSLQEYEVAVAEAKQVTAEIVLLDVQIAKRTIRAPFGGVLGLKLVDEGSYLSPGMSIVPLISNNPINLEFSVPERYALSIQTGGTVEFQLDGSDRAFRAIIVAREPNIDSGTRTLKLKASAPNPRGEILPGAFANVRVSLAAYEKAILVPTEAVIPEMGGKKIYLYRSGRAEAVPVETGIRRNIQIQILDGLQVGDTVITTGVLQLQPGVEVTITELEQT